MGVNGGSAPPAVPWNQPFLWRDEGTNSQIIAMWHPGVLTDRGQNRTASADTTLPCEHPITDASACGRCTGVAHVVSSILHAESKYFN